VKRSPARLKNNRLIYGLISALDKAGHDGNQIKKDLAYEISRGKTEKSSELNDGQHRLLARAMIEAADKAGIKKKKKPRPLPAPPGVTRMRESSQLKTLTQLLIRLGKTPDEILTAKKKAKTTAQASAAIEKFKSILVRESNLIVFAAAAVIDPDKLAKLEPKEVELLTDIVKTAGSGQTRKINKIKAGAVIWGFDIQQRFQKAS